ncbi:MAG: hypothetical protein R3F07_16900 [Opitutaceae bacterium]
MSKSREESYGGGPHEGVDFALAEMTSTGRVEAGLEGMRVPVFTTGRIIWSFADLVGDTVIVATGEKIEDFRFVIQYSHIDFEKAALGEEVSGGTDIGRIKLSNNPKSITASHLHVSTALLRDDLLSLPPTAVDFTNWLHWEREGSLIYLDPLGLLESAVRDRLFVTGKDAESPIALLIGSGSTKEDRLILRRVLARSFPGLHTVSRQTVEEAVGDLGDRGLFVWNDARKWQIRAGRSLTVPSGSPIEGEGFEELVEAIRSVEMANAIGR